MTGLLACAAKAVTVGTLAATGALVATDQFDTGTFNTASRGAITTNVGVDSNTGSGGADASVGVTADAGAPGGDADMTGTIDAGISIDGGTPSSDTSPAPCAAGCADPLGLPTLDGAAVGRAAFSADPAPEQSCGCADPVGGVDASALAGGSTKADAGEGSASGGGLARGSLSID
jgi:hypothetical protein